MSYRAILIAAAVLIALVEVALIFLERRSGRESPTLLTSKLSPNLGYATFLILACALIWWLAGWRAAEVEAARSGPSFDAREFVAAFGSGALSDVRDVSATVRDLEEGHPDDIECMTIQEVCTHQHWSINRRHPTEVLEEVSVKTTITGVVNADACPSGVPRMQFEVGRWKEGFPLDMTIRDARTTDPLPEGKPPDGKWFHVSDDGIGSGLATSIYEYQPGPGSADFKIDVEYELRGRTPLDSPYGRTYFSPHDYGQKEIAHHCKHLRWPYQIGRYAFFDETGRQLAEPPDGVKSHLSEGNRALNLLATKRFDTTIGVHYEIKREDADQDLVERLAQYIASGSDR